MAAIPADQILAAIRDTEMRLEEVTRGRGQVVEELSKLDDVISGLAAAQVSKSDMDKLQAVERATGYILTVMRRELAAKLQMIDETEQKLQEAKTALNRAVLQSITLPGKGN